MNDVLEPVPQSQESNDSQSSQVNTVGWALSLSREEKNWTVQYVAEQLKLSQSQIAALESNQFELLPKLVIVRGFVRAYAKLLKIDADPLVAMLPQGAAPMHLDASLKPALSTPFVDSRMSLHGQNNHNRRYIIGVVILVVLIVFFGIFQKTEFGHKVLENFSGNGSDKQELNIPLNTKPAINTATEMPVASSAMIENESIVKDEPLKIVAPISPPSMLNRPIDSGTSSKNEESTLVPKISENAQLTASNLTMQNVPLLTDSLVLRFRQNSWIQVKNMKGVVLSAHLANAGSQESFSVKDGLQIKVGNAAGVEAALRGKALPIVSDHGSNVANFVVK